MMRSLLYIILFFSVIACTKEIVISESDIKCDLYYLDGSLVPFTGKCKVMYKDTNLVSQEFQYRKGRLNGLVCFWYKNGKPERRGYYKNGLLTGKWEFWDINGNKISEANYKNDSLEGPYITWYPNGKVQEKGQFENNLRVGKWSRFTETGQVQSNVATME